MNILKRYSEKLGPGMLFAAASVGTSHLVQSTRAGADYGLALWWVILLACLIKYPAFSFGPAYAAATGESLLDNYRRQGRWAVAIFVLELFVNMFIATAAVALITGGLINNILGLGLEPLVMTGLLLIAGGILLVSGKYHLFEKVTTLFVVLFTLLILVAVVLAVPHLEWQTERPSSLLTMDLKTILFVIAFAGWMPTALGASVFQSLWVCAKSKDLKRPVTPQEARFDFNLGFIGTAFLAFCFLFLGLVFMHQEGMAVAASAAGFAGQFMGLFTAAIGGWAYPVIAVAAIAIMCSTLLTLMDACPRALDNISGYLFPNARRGSGSWYPGFLLVECLGAILMLTLFMRSFKTFIDFATSVAFLVAPLIAFINHRAIFSPSVPEQLQPSGLMRAWSILGITALALFALCYLYFGIFSG